MGHPDDQSTGGTHSFRTDDTVMSHDVDRMSDAELLALYQGLFAQADAGQHPDTTYLVYGPSLRELAEGGDELSRAGNELVQRYGDREWAVREFLDGHLSAAETPGVTIRLFSDHDSEHVGSSWRDPVAHVALTAFVAAVTVNGDEWARHNGGESVPPVSSGTSLIFLGGLDMRTGQVLTMHEYAAIHQQDVAVRDEAGLVGVSLPIPGVKAFAGVLGGEMGHALIDYLGEKLADHLVDHLEEWIDERISDGEHGADPGPTGSNYGLLYLAVDSGIADGDGTTWDMQHPRDSELSESSAPTTDDVAHEIAVHMVQVLTDTVPPTEGPTDLTDYGDRPVDIESASYDTGSATPSSTTGSNMETDAAATGNSVTSTEEPTANVQVPPLGDQTMVPDGADVGLVDAYGDQVSYPGDDGGAGPASDMGVGLVDHYGDQVSYPGDDGGAGPASDMGVGLVDHHGADDTPDPGNMP